jgi:hypothetical protein
MFLITITLALILFGIGAYFYGAFRLSKYAFRISGGLGVGVLLFPPLTFYFALWKLEEEGKELPTALCMFGLVTSIVLVGMFWTPLSLFASGQYEAKLAELESGRPNFEAPAVVPQASAPAQPQAAPAADHAGNEAAGEGATAEEGSEAAEGSAAGEEAGTESAAAE